MWGIDSLVTARRSSVRQRLQDSPCALLTHSAAGDARGRTTHDVVRGLGILPKVLFTPEHGLWGVAQAEESVASESASDGMQIRSLYGSDEASLTPSPDEFDDVSVLLIDLVDVGSRYYTYVWTALKAARVAIQKGVHVVCLDRPNPLGGNPADCEGRRQAEGFCSFVGLEPVAVRHGLTIGELLAYWLSADGYPLGPDGAFSLVPCHGWERLKTQAAWGRPFVPPSPNMPSLETALLYPGGCLVEGTNLSEGRGTAFPFRVVGAPFLNADALATSLSEAGLDGVQFRPWAFRPSFEKHSGSVCRGVMLHVTDPVVFRPVSTYLTLLNLARAQAPDEFVFLERAYEFETKHPAFDLLTGSAAARASMLEGASPTELRELVANVDAEWPELHAQACELGTSASCRD